MPVTPIPGSVRLRQFQLGKETTLNTVVAATRRMPWQAVPSIDPHTTFPTADTGTLDQAIAPYQTAYDLTYAIGPSQLYSNDCPSVFASMKGGVTAVTTSTSDAWTYQPSSTTQDTFDTFSTEWYDDSGDGYTESGGIFESWALDYPADMGPITLSGTWRNSSVTYNGTPTGSLNVDLSPVPLFMADTSFYVNDTSGAIETTKLSDIAYSAQIAYTGNIDVKRFANGSNQRFQVRNYGRGERVISFTLTGAKQSAWIAEAAKWIAASPTERFWGVRTDSTVAASAGIPHSLDIRFPGYWLTRAENDQNSNTAFSLTGHQVYDSGLGYAIFIKTVNTRATL